MSEATFSTDDILEVGPSTVEKLKKMALESPRGQSRLCMHHSVDDQLHEMLNVCARGAYVRPHRHPQGKTESYHIIEGEMTVYFFDDDGSVTRRLKLGPPGTGASFLYRLSASLWHMPVADSEVVVYHETFCGPFRKDADVEYAPWSPEDTHRSAIDSLLRQLD